MTTLQTSTLRPGLLVSLKTSQTGNVKYAATTIEGDHTTAEGKRKAKWETVRLIDDPAEHDAACKVRSKAAAIVRSVCANSAFGLLCPENKSDQLEAAVREARKLVDDFNAASSLSRVSLYIITGRVAADDVEAVKAINSEVRELLTEMEIGLRNLDVKTVRDAANRARNIGGMLTTEAKTRVQMAIDAAREAARKIVKAGEEGAVQIDLVAISAITDQRVAFLDMDEVTTEVQAPAEVGRGVDLDPGIVVSSSTPPVATAELEF